uniref:1-aminocyclopropane-1-carboxylate oxidase isoform X2 n=1 Tax=Elaeis guineensis var. tenera TaxID=51953 RepID=A0A6I9S587_ELAGV|nr:1-aminocyclopropane-1-carboxylate oxidase isoform X2 [Elaeis guineensis]
MSKNLDLPLIDLSSTDRAAAARSIRQACVEYGFFYLINHGIEDGVFRKLFEESKKFFSLPLDEKMKLERNGAHRGYTPMYAETLDPSSKFEGDLKESFYIGPEEGSNLQNNNQWPSEGELAASDYGNFGASAHSDYGMVTLLVTDGVPGLQICREKDKHSQLWEDVHHVDGAFIVNVGDLLERWTNCLFRSTLHRVLAVGQERYSVAFFCDPHYDCVVECLESCCGETSPPRFPPIRCGDHLEERIRTSYASK